MKRLFTFIIIMPVILLSICRAGESGYTLLETWGKKGTGNGEFNNPCGIAVDGKGQVYIADEGNNCIQKFTSSGKFIEILKTANPARAVAVDASGNIYVAEAGAEAGTIEKFSQEGKLIKEWKYAGRKNKKGGYSVPGGIAASGKYVYLGNNSTGSIQKFTTDGELVKSWGNLERCCGFLDVAVDNDENVYVAELGAHKMAKFDRDGNLIKKWGKFGEKEGEFCGCCNPVHIAVGSKGTIFTSEKSTPRIQEFTNDGKFICSFGAGIFSSGCGYMDLAASSTGKIFVVDDSACCVRVFGKK